MPHWRINKCSILGANTLSTGYDVENSLRFDDGSRLFK